MADELINEFKSLLQKLYRWTHNNVFMHKKNLLMRYFPMFSSFIPTVAIIELKRQKLSAPCPFTLPKSTEILAETNGITSFRTTQTIIVNPLTIIVNNALMQTPKHYCIRLRFNTLNNVNLHDCHLDPLILHINTNLQTAIVLIDVLIHYPVIVRWFSENDKILNEKSVQVQPAFDYWHQGLKATNSLDALPIFHCSEWFYFPQKYCFIQICGLRALNHCKLSQYFELEWRFPKTTEFDTLAQVLREVSTTSLFKLHCVPVTNLSKSTIEPILLTSQEGDYALRLAQREPKDYAIDSLATLIGQDSQGCRYRFNTLAPMHVDNVITEEQGIEKFHSRPIGGNIVLFGGASGVSESLRVTLTAVQAPLWLSGTVWFYNKQPIEFENLSLAAQYQSERLVCHALTVRSGSANPNYHSQFELIFQCLTWDYKSIFISVDRLKQCLGYCCLLEISNNECPNLDFIEGIVAVAVKLNKQWIGGVGYPVYDFCLSLQEQAFPSTAMMRFWAKILTDCFAQSLAINSIVHLHLQLLPSQKEFFWEYPWPYECTI